MNVLITGGAGFIGSNLALHLRALGHTVTVLDVLAPQIHGHDPKRDSPLYRSIANSVSFIHGSVLDRATCEQALRGQEAIVHLAAETGTGQSMYEIQRYVDVNVGGTALMLDMLANGSHTVRKFVVASSRAVYGEGKYQSDALGIVYPGPRKEADLKAAKFEPLCPQTGCPMQVLPTDEDSKLHPTSVYGITKLNQEQMVLTVCRSLGIPAVALRYQNVYGPGQSLSNPYTGILSIFSTRVRNGNPINIFEDGRESRDFVYIDDVVEATKLSLLSETVADEVFGIGSGVPTDVLTVARTLIGAYGVEVPVTVTGGFRVGDIRHNFADTRKAERLLGFRSRTSFAAGIAKFAAWVQSQDVVPDTYDRSIEEMRRKGLFKN